EHDVARVAGGRDQLIQPVHRAQEGALAAARRPDQGGHGTAGNGDRDVEQGLGRAVPEAVGPYVDDGRRAVGEADGPLPLTPSPRRGGGERGGGLLSDR